MAMNINGPKETGIPVPLSGPRGPRPLYVIDDLCVGDSRFFNAPPKNVRAALWPRFSALGWKMVSAAEGSGIRVWRVE